MPPERYDLLLATRRRVMPTGFHKTMPWRQRSELAASDFALRLQVEEEQPGVKRFCTGDQADGFVTMLCVHVRVRIFNEDLPEHVLNQSRIH